MRYHISLKKIVLFICLLLVGLQGFANNFSYVYIQGDKQTPFYVKFEDEMLPRYGKNYSIISQLAPGPIHIQVLFQQNAYPAQSFVIQVPENGARGFLLTRTETGFALYDINQQFYLQAGNKAEDDHIPESVSTPPPPPAVAATTPAQAPPSVATIKEEDVTNISQLKAVEGEEQEPEAESTTTPANDVPVATPPVATTNTTAPATNAPQFLSDVELKNEKNIQTGGTIAVDNSQYKGKIAIVNSDCPNALNNELFEAILKKATDKTEKTRLKYLMSRTEGNCYTTNQVRTLTNTLNNDPEKYTFLKAAYPRITDQSKFPGLEALLSSEEWKSYFRLIIP